MRISSQQFFQQNLRTFNAAESRLLELQKQVASGVAVDQASQDPEAFITALKAQDVINEAEQYNRNITLVRLRFTQQEESLASAGDIMNAVRDSALQAKTGTASDFDRSVLAQDIRLRVDELRSVLNTKDIDGLYIFGSGNQSLSPFMDPNTGNAAANIAPNPNQQYQLRATATGTPIAVDIAAGRTVKTGFDPGTVFANPLGPATTGSTAAPQSVLEMLQNLADAIESGNMTEVDRLTGGIEKSSELLLKSRVEAGTRSRQLDDAESFNLNQIVQASETKEKSVGADLSATITELTQTDAQLRALQVTYSQITKNSLFDLI